LNQVYGLEDITIRCLSFTELLNVFNRISRFENPIKKNMTVAKMVLSKASVTPKITNKTLAELLPATIDSLVKSVWDVSVKNLGGPDESDYLLNMYLAYEECQSFSASECIKELLFSGRSINLEHPVSINRFTDLTSTDTLIVKEFESLLMDNAYDIQWTEHAYLKDLDIYQKLYIAIKMSYPLNLKSFLEYLNDNTVLAQELPAGVVRFIELNNLIEHFKNEIAPQEFLNHIYKLSSSLRKKLSTPLPPRVLLLVEGITEEILLPKFAQLLTYDFNTDGIFLISAGGKNKVAKFYNKYKRQLTIPIALLLDADAEEIIEELTPGLRPHDKLISIHNGEFEDLLPKDLICKAVNDSYMLSPNLKLAEIDQQESIARQLCIIWKNFGLGDFNKSHFASTIYNYIDDPKFITDEMNRIIKEIYQIL
jgi:hypothetical protein